jgi:hypothetical protein
VFQYISLSPVWLFSSFPIPQITVGVVRSGATAQAACRPRVTVAASLGGAAPRKGLGGAAPGGVDAGLLRQESTCCLGRISSADGVASRRKGPVRGLRLWSSPRRCARYFSAVGTAASASTLGGSSWPSFAADPVEAFCRLSMESQRTRSSIPASPLCLG